MWWTCNIFYSFALSCTLASNFFRCKLVHSNCSKLSKIFPQARFKCSRKDQVWTSISTLKSPWNFCTFFRERFRFVVFLSVSVCRAERERAALANPENPEEEAAVGLVGEIDESSIWNSSFHIMFVWKFCKFTFSDFPKNLSGFWWSPMAGECGATTRAPFGGDFGGVRPSTKVTDLHRVMEVAKSLWLLLEHSNEVGDAPTIGYHRTIAMAYMAWLLFDRNSLENTGHGASCLGDCLRWHLQKGVVVAGFLARFLDLREKCIESALRSMPVFERCSFRFSDHDKREYFKDSNFFRCVSRFEMIW